MTALVGILTCPHCGAKQQAEIPTDRCQHAYVCNGCGKTVSSRVGDCCVFCSYGDRKCSVTSGAG